MRSRRLLALTPLLVAAHALVAPPRRVTRREAAPSSDEFPTDAPARTQETYLDRLAAYADEDGYTSTPLLDTVLRTGG